MHGRQTYTKEEEEEEKGSPGFNERTPVARGATVSAVFSVS